MTPDPFYSKTDLLRLGFTSIGDRVTISRKCSLYSIRGSVGSDVRIDDFCILKGHLEIGSHVHVCAFCSLSGVEGTVSLSDFCTLANRVSVYTGSDDYRADALSSSTIPKQYRKTISGDVHLGRASLVGAHSVILPGATVGDAASIGALCIVRGHIPSGAVATSHRRDIEITGRRNVSVILDLAEEVNRLTSEGR